MMRKLVLTLPIALITASLGRDSGNNH
jgi:hypothetical protein